MVSGVHRKLSGLVGSWEGTTKTWFEPGVLADESPIRGTTRSILDGRFILHEYNSSLKGKPLSGVATFGFDLTTGTYQCAWVDSFHMSTAILLSESTNSAGKLFSALGSYGVPGVAERWGWKTEIEMPDDNKLAITMFNIAPSGEEAKAVETIYTRV